jgi:hypothetical protein
MRYTIWSNAGRFEYLVYDGGGELVTRSGLIFRNRAAAKRAMIKAI